MWTDETCTSISLLLAEMRLSVVAVLILALSVNAQNIPDFFDTRIQWPFCGYQILDQDRCGGCYAFAVASLCSCYMLTKKIIEICKIMINTRPQCI